MIRENERLRGVGVWTLGMAATLLLATACDSDARRARAPARGGRGAGGAAAPSSALLLDGVHLPGGESTRLRIVSDRISAVGPNIEVGDAEKVDASGFWIVPGYVDSHVHLSYYPVGDQLPATGIFAAIDLAAPLASFETDGADLELVRSGPMLTAPLGYPTQSWGRDGYGWEVASPDEARAAVTHLVELGAGVIKLPIVDPALDDDTILAVVKAAHQHDRRVACHALGAAEAERAARLGCDILAHTPTEPLDDAVVAQFAQRTVVSTLAAFGGGANAVDNLRRLHTAGARVLYGTDLGNLMTIGLSTSELSLMAQAGLSPAEVLASVTRSPDEFWKLDAVGPIAAGEPASFVLLHGDPLLDPSVLAQPARVYLAGRAVSP